MSKNTFTKFYRSTYTYLHMRARKHARTHTINIIMSKNSFTKFYRSTYTYLHMHARKHARTHTINIIITTIITINIKTAHILVSIWAFSGKEMRSNPQLDAAYFRLVLSAQEIPHMLCAVFNVYSVLLLKQVSVLSCPTKHYNNNYISKFL